MIIPPFKKIENAKTENMPLKGHFFSKWKIVKFESL